MPGSGNISRVFACMGLALVASRASTQIVVAPGRQLISTKAKPCQVTDYRILLDARADASGMMVDGCTLVATYMGVQLQSKSHPAERFTLRNSTITLKAPVAKATAVPTGFHAKWGRDVLVENVVARGFRTVIPAGSKTYPNGDGFGSEFAVGLTYRRATAIDNANGGFDDKAHHVRYEDTISEGNVYGYRMWWRGPGNFRGTTMTCRNNTSACLQLNRGKRPDFGDAHVEIDHLVVENVRATPIVRMQPGTTLIVHRCSIVQPAGPPFFAGMDGGDVSNVTLKLGPGCLATGGARNTSPERLRSTIGSTASSPA